MVLTFQSMLFHCNVIMYVRVNVNLSRVGSLLEDDSSTPYDEQKMKYRQNSILRVQPKRRKEWVEVRIWM